jgi:hypothetical protein
VPNIGDVIKGEEIGKAPGKNFVWTQCAMCQVPRYVLRRVPMPETCTPCNRLRHPVLYGRAMHLPRDAAGRVVYPD